MICYDVYTIVFKYLSFNSQWKAKRMSRLTEKCDVRNFLEATPYITSKLNKTILSHYKNISKLQLIDTDIKLDNIKNIETLELINCNIISYCQLPLLENLSVVNSTHDCRDVTCLILNAPKLKVLQLTRQNIASVDCELNHLEELDIKLSIVRILVPNLVKLVIEGYYGIFDSQYVNTLNKLKYLDIRNTHKSYDVKKMTLLTTLSANKHITFEDINSLTNLKNLDVSECENFDVESYRNEKIEILCINGAQNFDFLINKFKNLKELSLSNVFINDKIKSINKIEKLSLYDCVFESNQSICFSKLKCLKLSRTVMNYNFISNLTNLTELHFYDMNNLKKIDLNCLQNLTTLYVYNTDEITDDSISKLQNIENLIMANNESICDISHLTRLRKLNIYGKQCIDFKNNNNLTNLTNLKYVFNMSYESVETKNQNIIIPYYDNVDTDIGYVGKCVYNPRERLYTYYPFM